MRVLHFITSLGLGGAEHALVRLIGSLDRARFEHVVVCLLEEGPLAAPLRDAGVEVVALDLHPGRPTPAGLLRARRELRRAAPDLVQTWLYHADLLGTLLVDPWGTAAERPALIWNIRAADMDFTRYRALSRWTVRMCVRLSARPDGIVVNSEAGRRHHEALGYRPRQWVVIGNGVDPTVFHPDAAARDRVRTEIGVAPDAPVVGLVARLDPMKDHETFLRAAALLARDRPDVAFVLAGAGVTPSLPAFAALAARVAPGLTLHALGPRRDIPRLTAAFDIGTCTSRTEGFPNVVIETMACGVPCVSTDVGDAARILDTTGVIVPPGRPDALAAAWGRLLADAGARAALGARGRARVLERYTIGQVAAAYDALYERMAAPGAVAAVAASRAVGPAGGRR